MRRYFFLFFFAITVQTVFAQSRGFGLGVIVGDPTGVSGKYWLSGSTAIDGAAAWSFGKNDALQAQADFVLHKFDLISVEKGRLPFYFGIGGVAVFGDKLGLGARVPVGLDYQFAATPLDIFVEIVPGIALTPSTDFILDGGLGIRYWF